MQLKNIAPEFYTTLKYHTSWIYVIWAFLTDSDVGPWTRMKRKTPTGTPADAPVMATGVFCPSVALRAAHTWCCWQALIDLVTCHMVTCCAVRFVPRFPGFMLGIAQLKRSARERRLLLFLPCEMCLLLRTDPPHHRLYTFMLSSRETCR